MSQTTGQLELDDVGGLTYCRYCNICKTKSGATPSHISWEIWEYTGLPGGANEMFVHTQDQCNLPALTTSVLVQQLQIIQIML